MSAHPLAVLRRRRRPASSSRLPSWSQPRHASTS